MRFELRRGNDSMIEFKVNKETVLQDGIRQQDVVTDASGLGSRYVMVATGPIYRDPEGTDKITMVNGDGKWNHCAYTDVLGMPYELHYGLGDTWYKDEDTEVTVIYDIGNGEWNKGLPKKQLVSSWGAPTDGDNCGYFDANLFRALFGFKGFLWTGTKTIDRFWGQGIYLGMLCFDCTEKSSDHHRVQSAIFK